MPKRSLNATVWMVKNKSPTFVMPKCHSLCHTRAFNGVGRISNMSYRDLGGVDKIRQDWTRPNGNEQTGQDETMQDWMGRTEGDMTGLDKTGRD